ncbi:MAG: hypothetical protein Q8S13_01680, partial [Dehalococcoidia bacterium]|nr:hypothetical protein [Dehalococcoidia bacterium]
MTCTRRGFLKTMGAALVGLGITRLDSLRTFAASSVSRPDGPALGGPAAGPFSIDSLRTKAVEAAAWVGDGDLAHELREVCCWAPAATAIRRLPLDAQRQGAQRFFSDFPGGDQLAEVMVYTNNTTWRAPRFRFDPDSLVSQHYSLLQRSQNGVRTEVLRPDRLNGNGARAQLGLMLDRTTGERLAKMADRSEAMWAALSVFSGMMLDPTDELSGRLTPLLSLSRAHDRALARSSTVTYSQIVIGAV